MMRREELRSVRRVEVIAVVVARGTGADDDPVRLVTLHFDDDGECVAERDPLHITPWFGKC